MTQPSGSPGTVSPVAGRRARLASIVAILLALGLLAWLAIGGYRGNVRATQARDNVEETLALIGQAQALETAALRMEAAHRAWLLRPDAAQAAERDEALGDARARQARLAAHYAGDPVQAPRIAEVGTLLSARAERIRTTVGLVETAGLATAQAQFRDRGEGSLVPLRAQLGALAAHEQERLRRYSAGAQRDVEHLNETLVLGTGAAFVLLLLAALQLVRMLLRTEAMGDELRQQSSDLSNLFRLSRDLICIASPEGRFLRLNPAWERTLGLPVAKMVGRPFLEFVHPDDVERSVAETAALANGAETVAFENRYRDAGGRWRWLLWNAKFDEGAGVIYATARDITERKHAEQRIDALNAELLAGTQALESANRELESFSYSVSHDLRAPLRHIDGYARMLVEDAGDRLQPEDRRYLATITDSVRRMGALIDDLLALSRWGRKPLDRQPIDMGALARDALRDLPGPLPAIAVGDLPPVDGDPTLLRQVWSNLLSNAVKYSAPRGDEAQVRVDGESVDGVVRYRVRDNGVGFDMRHAGKLFGVFQRLHGDERFEGTGVGLAIVQRVVHRHGGQVRAEAEPERGATFTFDLPVGAVGA